ncbi:MAG: DUF1822 family protein, partial [Jaaginema sp. PMC 1079.18]|nr:DUF1822 family protein [Jaaginema sp. PMC 1079.18]
MTYPTSFPMTFTIPVSYKARQLAQTVYQKAGNIKQVYLNVLASYATNYYLSCLGFTTDLENSPSQDPVQQILSNTGALIVNHNQILECRPVLPDSDTCHIPLELHQERHGYVAVALNQELTEATILGFYPQVSQENMPVSQLENLDALIEHLYIPAVVSAVQPQTSTDDTVVRLSHWLENTIEMGWEIIDSLLPPSPQFAFRSRTTEAPTVEC